MLDKSTPRSFNAYDRPHADLREFVARTEEAGELLRVKGAHWDLEMGTLAEIVYHARPEPPAILFEDVPGYPKGMRLLSGATNSSKRLAITLGFPVPNHPLYVVRAYRDRMKNHRPIPPKTVSKGPVMENIDRDDAVDLFKFPVPRLHELDGGRYIGTDDLVIMRDRKRTGSTPPPTGQWCRTRTMSACGSRRASTGGRSAKSIIAPASHARC